MLVERLSVNARRLESADAHSADVVPSLRSVVLSALAGSVPEGGAERDPGFAFLLAQPALHPELCRQSLCGRGQFAPELGLRRLANTVGLTKVEVLTLVLLLAVDDEPLIAQAVAALQAPAHGSRPTLGLLSSAFSGYGEGRSVTEQVIGGAALASGLIELDSADGALPERSVTLPTGLFLALRGLDGPLPRVTILAGDEGDAVPLGPSIERELVLHALALRAESGVLCVRSSSLTEARTAATTVARTLGCRPALVDIDHVPSGLGPFLLLRELLPVFMLSVGPGERRRLPSIAGYQGPVLAAMGPDGAVETAHGTVPELTLPVPAVEERQLLWTLALGDAELARQLAARYRQGAGRIAHLGRLARHYAALESLTAIEMRHVHSAAWTVEGGGLGSLAQAQRDPVPDEAFVASPHVRRELEHLLLRCGVREGLPDHLGPTLRGRTRAAVRALFVGPSGTGKTLAASWLATRIGVPLYRIDLASVTSKYIGETEKNLAEVLARAERADVALLFDEADSLFGRRTEVRDSNDRFANAQTNYLLQRIETYEGIVLLTSNSRSRFDSAFSRRLDAVIEFGLPGPEERRALWRAHLGDAHTLSPEQLNRLAAAADVAGGSIRNAVLAGAVLAAHASRPIDYADVLVGLTSEYKKLGQSLPAELSAAAVGR